MSKKASESTQTPSTDPALMGRRDDVESKKMYIETEEDYIDSGRYNYSIKNFLDSHPDGASDAMICRFLLINQDVVTKTYQEALKKLKSMLTD